MTDPRPDAPARPRRRLALRILFFVSLALNLLVAGLVIGAVLTHGRGGPHAGPPRDPGMPYTRALSEEDRRELFHAMRDAMRATRPDRRDYDAAYARAVQLLRSEPFDGAAFGAALEDQNAGARMAQEIGRDVLVAHLSGMSPEARAAYADRLQEVLEERREWHRERRERARERESDED